GALHRVIVRLRRHACTAAVPAPLHVLRARARATAPCVVGGTTMAPTTVAPDRIGTCLSAARVTRSRKAAVNRHCRRQERLVVRNASGTGTERPHWAAAGLRRCPSGRCRPPRAATGPVARTARLPSGLAPLWCVGGVCSKRKRVPAPLLLCSHTENEAKGERGPS